MWKALILFFILTACRNELFLSQTSVDVEFDNYRTFAFLPESASVGFDDEIIRFRSMQIVKEELDARGFELDLDSPDFLIRIHTFFSSSSDPTENPDFRSPTDGPGPRLYFEGRTPRLATPGEIPDLDYAPGTIAIEILDAIDGSLLWNAWSEQVVSPNALPEDLENYMGRLLEKFPADVQ